jgi:hypothetical protein
MLGTLGKPPALALLAIALSDPLADEVEKSLDVIWRKMATVIKGKTLS